jgi:fido (protein-threonine AMPylation protein)
VFLEQFFAIHPFVDGNGRIGRLYLERVALEHGFEFDLAMPNHKARRSYLRALEHAHMRSEDRTGRFRHIRNPVWVLERWIAKRLRLDDATGED